MIVRKLYPLGVVSVVSILERVSGGLVWIRTTLSLVKKRETIVAP